MTSFHFQTHVSPGEGIYIPPNPEFDGRDVVVTVDFAAKSDDQPKREISLDDISGAWKDDERTAEEIIRDIYESRVNSRDRGPL